MTVLSTDPPYSQYTGTGERVFFEYGFEWTGSTVYVEVDGVPVTFTQQSTGVVLDVAPPLGSSINIYRNTDITQERDFTAFDGFVSSWTEDALDKLILLKQEAGYFRAQTNLAAIPYLEKVEIDNSKGTNPDIYIWNTDMSGVFAGEVTDNPPLIGSYVEKPDDFVYLFYGPPFQVQEFTTTLYPAEATDAISFSADLGSANLRNIPSDEAATTDFSIVSVFRNTILLSTNEGPDEAEHSFDLVSVDRQTILLSTNEGPDEAEHSWSLISVVREDLLVTAYSPDHGLIMSVDLDAANCSLDSV
jgi:hypothetical protein